MMKPIAGGRAAEHLEAWSHGNIRMLLWSLVAVLAAVDCVVPAIGMTPLYLLLVCAAAWRLNQVEVLGFAVATSLISLVPSMIDDLSWPPQWPFTAAPCVACSLLLAGLVSSFRSSYERERFLARHDVMTGAMNRATFALQARLILAAARRARRPLMLAVVDLDDFKVVNDEYGHAAGDAVVRAFAVGATKVLRRRDIFGRLGGDEFAMIMPIETLDQAQQVASTLHRRLSSVLSGLPTPVTMSTGALVVMPGASIGLDGLLHQADGLMYKGKRREKGSLVVGQVGSGVQADSASFSAPWAHDLERPPVP
jgi:diguanylate cyclase (GGDEF)-like protein